MQRGLLALAGLVVLGQASGAFAAVETVPLKLRPCGTPCHRTGAESCTDKLLESEPLGDLEHVAADLFCELTCKKERNIDPLASWRLYTSFFSQGLSGSSASQVATELRTTNARVAPNSSNAERDPFTSWRLYTSSFSQGFPPSQGSLGRPF